MSKFHLFVIIFSFTLLLMVADVLTNGYLKGPRVHNELPANIYSSASLPTEKTASLPKGTSPEDIADTTESDKKTFSFSLLLEIGFKNVILAKIPFQGILFESIDLRDIKNVDIEVYNILDNDRRRIATFYAFNTHDGSIADELYSLVRQKALLLPNASLNETNAFGTASFYINFKERTTFTFLVVNQGRNVYALTYQKDLHPFIKKLITFLP